MWSGFAKYLEAAIGFRSPKRYEWVSILESLTCNCKVYERARRCPEPETLRARPAVPRFFSGDMPLARDFTLRRRSSLRELFSVGGGYSRYVVTHHGFYALSSQGHLLFVPPMSAFRVTVIPPPTSHLCTATTRQTPQPLVQRAPSPPSKAVSVVPSHPAAHSARLTAKPSAAVSTQPSPSHRNRCSPGLAWSSHPPEGKQGWRKGEENTHTHTGREEEPKEGVRTRTQRPASREIRSGEGGIRAAATRAAHGSRKPAAQPDFSPRMSRGTKEERRKVILAVMAVMVVMGRHGKG
ncbi:hypothetical protein LZ30DRAFT_222784 [Colletotrichum cereale]|nr:hypothetical protein LZ30DRAFT_222784 [Colletotrichum cereale]